MKRFELFEIIILLRANARGKPLLVMLFNWILLNTRNFWYVREFKSRLVEVIIHNSDTE